jgi:hypothetical protein
MAKVLFLHGLESKPGGSKPRALEKLGHQVSNPALPMNDFDESVRIAQEEIDFLKPNVIVGSSRGGAVAMSIDPGNAKMILIAPAWRKFDVQPKVPSDTTILHCPADGIIDFEDSEILETSCQAQLISCGQGHRMNDPDALQALSDLVC